MKKILSRSDCPFCTTGTPGGGGTCNYCGGVGEVGVQYLAYECATCETTGQVGGETCTDCSGLGHVPVNFELIEDMVDKINDIFEKVNE